MIRKPKASRHVLMTVTYETSCKNGDTSIEVG
jgi:hypothetical protein